MRRAAPPVWLAQPSRFALLSKVQAAWVAAALAVLIAAALSGTGMVGDLEFDMAVDGVYDAIIGGLRAGGDYYQLAADTLRAGGYPLRPFLALRLPMHAVVQAALPLAASLALLWLLAVAVMAAWWVRLAEALPRPLPRLAAAILLAVGMVAFVSVDAIAIHEIWAAQLIALSMALRRPHRWVEAVALALVAMLVRETAALYVAVMGGLALLEGFRREALGWLCALLLFLLALAAHAHGVASVTGPLDAALAGWQALHGFGFFVTSLIAGGALKALPLALAAILVALALFGWAAWRDALALRAITTFVGYAAAIALFAPADAMHWALLPAPVFLVGLVFIPDTVRDIGRALLDRPRVRIQRVSR